MWRQASLPAVEGGILPPGKTVHLSKRSHFTMTIPVATQFRRAGSPGSTSAKMADATIFRQALKSHRHVFGPHLQTFILIFPNHRGVGIQKLWREFAAGLRQQLLRLLRGVFVGVIVI